jgi:hypothetical protein
MSTIKAKDIHARAMVHDPEYREAYESLEGEFTLVDALIGARACPSLAGRSRQPHGNHRSAVSRLESGRVKPSTRTLERYAEAPATACAPAWNQLRGADRLHRNSSALSSFDTSITAWVRL